MDKSILYYHIMSMVYTMMSKKMGNAKYYGKKAIISSHNLVLSF